MKMTGPHLPKTSGECFFSSVFFSTNPVKDRNFEVLRMIGPRENIRQFMVSFDRYSKSIQDSIGWYSFSDSNLYLIGSYSKSVRRIVLENGGIIKDLRIHGGIEKFILIFLTRESLVNFYREISLVASIMRKKEEHSTLMEIDSDEAPLLTSTEHEILSFCLKNGFFESPRNLTMTELMHLFGKSKATINYHIRKGIKKILSNYLSVNQ